MSSLIFGSSSSTASEGYHIAYEELHDIAHDFLELNKRLSYSYRRGGGNSEHVELYEDLSKTFANNRAAQRMNFFAISARQGMVCADDASRTAIHLADAISQVAYLTQENEKKVQHESNYISGNGAVRSPGFESQSHAEGFYAAAAAAEAQRLKEEEEAAAAAAATAAAAAAAAAEQQAIDDFVREHWPELWAEIEEKRRKAEEDEWLEGIREKDPELYESIMAERKRQEDARKAAEQAAAELEAELSESGLDLGGGLNGGLDSDFGGGGGGGLGGADFGSFDDWAGDLMSDTIDGEELGASGEALDGIAGGAIDGANATGTDAVTDSELAAEAGPFSQYGEKLVSFAHAYGLQAAAAIGGGIALYATREQTTEAVAHVAEFVTTKCKPFASDVVEQVKGTAKKTRVNLANTKSKVVGVTRGEEAGDLIG